jgi:PIN domain nuclease of toxin-antitoxin system
VRLLLDTHIAVWVVTDSAKLKSSTREAIVAADAVWVSAATIWEIAIKFALRRGRGDDMPFSGTDALTHFAAANLRLLSIAADHAAAVDRLPPIHGDPFDRVLVVQAHAEGLTLMTDDARLAAYGRHILLV